jgi:hypothetical protein
MAKGSDIPDRAFVHGEATSPTQTLAWQCCPRCGEATSQSVVDGEVVYNTFTIDASLGNVPRVLSRLRKE